MGASPSRPFPKTRDHCGRDDRDIISVLIVDIFTRKVFDRHGIVIAHVKSLRLLLYAQALQKIKSVNISI